MVRIFGDQILLVELEIELRITMVKATVAGSHLCQLEAKLFAVSQQFTDSIPFCQSFLTVEGVLP
jgi:hypothetical protein